LKRCKTLEEQIRTAEEESEAQSIAAGAKRPAEDDGAEAWHKFFFANDATPAAKRAHRLRKKWDAFGELKRWRMTEMRDRRILFHHRDYPVRIWAVSIQRAGVIWHEIDAITKITEKWVSVRYQGENIRLHRENLSYCGAFSRGVRFASQRDGFAARLFDEWWHGRYGGTPGTPPTMQMPLAEAMALLGVPQNFTREDILAVFRRAVKNVHPDVGGTAEKFHQLVAARDRLLASLGFSAPAPPKLTPKGVRVRYRTVSIWRNQPRVSHTRQIAAQ
jgi:hypothetical protein